MPYVNDGSEWRDDRTRQARVLNDPMTVAAEKFVAVVENYLYNESHPGYQNRDYLGWSISQYDSTKRGSGSYANTLEWDPEDETGFHVAREPQEASRVSSADARITLSKDEEVRREKDGDAPRPEKEDSDRDPDHETLDTNPGFTYEDPTHPDGPDPNPGAGPSDPNAPAGETSGEPIHYDESVTFTKGKKKGGDA